MSPENISKGQPQEGMPEQKRWFEREPEPGKARITYKVSQNTEPIPVVDLPIRTLLKKGWGTISGTISVELTETEKYGGKSKYARLAYYLYDHYDYENRAHGIRIPEDSPVRKLPGIKYEIPPQVGFSRIGVCLDDNQLQELQLTEENRFLILKDVETSKVSEIQRYFGDETSNLLERREAHEEQRFSRAQSLSEAINVNGTSYLDTAALQQFDIQPDPESPGFTIFTALQRQI